MLICKYKVKFLNRRKEPKSFSGAVVEEILPGTSDIVVNPGEGGTFGEVLSDESVEIFV